MNGVDAVVLATMISAVEAGIHAYAAKSGQYSVCPMQKLKMAYYILARNTVVLEP
jgi:hydroxymethylglutaryl-CoA reductase